MSDIMSEAIIVSLKTDNTQVLYMHIGLDLWSREEPSL